MKKVAILAAVAFMIPMSGAHALTKEVKDACTSDYAAYCNGLKVGTPELRACMKSHSHMLSQPCVHALGHSSEVTQEDIREYKHAMHKD